jgi:hypothetical protein
MFVLRYNLQIFTFTCILRYGSTNTYNHMYFKAENLQILTLMYILRYISTNTYIHLYS